MAVSAPDTHKTAMRQKLPSLSDLELGEELIDRFAERYRTDAELRARCAGGGAARALAEHGMSTPGGADARIVENTDEVTWLVFPRDPNELLSDDMLGSVAGGAGAPPSCASTASTYGTLPSTVACLSSASSLCSE